MIANKLTREVRLLITFSALRNITDLFLGTFLVSFIMHLSASEIVSVSMYKLFEYAATCGGFFLFAHWCKRYNKVSVFALNLVPKIILLLMIIFMGDAVVDYVIPMGLLCGIGAAMYHLPMNSMVSEKVPTALVPRYLGVKNSVIYIVKIITPIVLGFFIDSGSYTEMAYVMLGVALLELLLTAFLHSSRHRSRTPIDFGGFFRCMLRFPVIRQMFSMEVLRGFSIGLLSTVIPMYTVYMFQTDFNLGMFTTVFSACSIAASWLFGRYGRVRFYRVILPICLMVIGSAMALFIYETVPLTFLLYNFVYSTAIVLLDLICSSCIFNLSNSKCVTANHRIEYFVFRDFALFIGRWIGFVGLMYIGVFGGYDWLRWYLLVITVAIMFTGIVSVRLSNNLRPRK